MLRQRTVIIQPGKPQQNTYVERVNRTVHHEWLSQYYWSDLDEVREFSTQWMWRYNHERPTWLWAASSPNSGWPWPHSSTCQSGGLWGDYRTTEGLRSRLCWVSELELANGSFRYFFDLEAQEWEGFYAMVLKFTNQEERLDERTLDEILKRAVANQGRWKKFNWASIQGRATFRLVQHKITDGMIDLKHLKAGLA